MKTTEVRNLADLYNRYASPILAYLLHLYRARRPLAAALVEEFENSQVAERFFNASPLAREVKEVVVKDYKSK